MLQTRKSFKSNVIDGKPYSSTVKVSLKAESKIVISQWAFGLSIMRLV